MTGADYDDPTELARRVAALPRPLVVGLDIDGVLAPLVPHADDARLSEGVAELLDRLDGVDGIDVAVVSGRSLAGLAHFGFSPELTVVGGHGGEVRGDPQPTLDTSEQARYDQLRHHAELAAAAAGEGAWVECKPLSVVLHVRQADDDSGRAALERLRSEVAGVDGVKATPGSAVLELFARPASKGQAIGRLRERHRAASLVYVGDDRTDEEAFAALKPGDLAIKVGQGVTIATHRLAGTDAVGDWLRATIDALEPT
ncbi:MAG: trehalose-phosphatase [Ilumatobacteraceae bacterium]